MKGDLEVLFYFTVKKNHLNVFNLEKVIQRHESDTKTY